MTKLTKSVEETQEAYQKLLDDMVTTRRSASAESAAHLRTAVAHIDRAFGDGYAERHPELIGAFMRTAAMRYQTETLTDVLTTVTARLDELIGKLATRAD